MDKETTKENFMKELREVLDRVLSTIKKEMKDEETDEAKREAYSTLAKKVRKLFKKGWAMEEITDFLEISACDVTTIIIRSTAVAAIKAKQLSVLKGIKHYVFPYLEVEESLPAALQFVAYIAYMLFPDQAVFHIQEMQRMLLEQADRFDSKKGIMATKENEEIVHQKSVNKETRKEGRWGALEKLLLGILEKTESNARTNYKEYQQDVAQKILQVGWPIEKVMEILKTLENEYSEEIHLEGGLVHVWRS